MAPPNDNDNDNDLTPEDKQEAQDDNKAPPKTPRRDVFEPIEIPPWKLQEHRLIAEGGIYPSRWKYRNGRWIETTKEEDEARGEELNASKRRLDECTDPEELEREKKRHHAVVNKYNNPPVKDPFAAIPKDPSKAFNFNPDLFPEPPFRRFIPITDTKTVPKFMKYKDGDIKSLIYNDDEFDPTDSAHSLPKTTSTKTAATPVIVKCEPPPYIFVASKSGFVLVPNPNAVNSPETNTTDSTAASSPSTGSTTSGSLETKKSDDAKKDSKDTTKSDEPSELDEINDELQQKLSEDESTLKDEDDGTGFNDGVKVSSAVANEGTALDTPSDNDTNEVDDSVTTETKDKDSNSTTSASPHTVTSSSSFIVDVNNILTPTPESSVASDAYESAREDFESDTSDSSDSYESANEDYL